MHQLLRTILFLAPRLQRDGAEEQQPFQIYTILSVLG